MFSDGFRGPLWKGHSPPRTAKGSTVWELLLQGMKQSEPKEIENIVEDHLALKHSN